MTYDIAYLFDLLAETDNLITLTLSTNFYYSENDLSAITSSSKHLNGHQIVAWDSWAATRAGLAYRVMGLVCKRSAGSNPGGPLIIASPILL